MRAAWTLQKVPGEAVPRAQHMPPDSAGAVRPAPLSRPLWIVATPWKSWGWGIFGDWNPPEMLEEVDGFLTCHGSWNTVLVLSREDIDVKHFVRGVALLKNGFRHSIHEYIVFCFFKLVLVLVLASLPIYLYLKPSQK